MGLFGALSSGVSGLTAQSSAMGAIADNITNVNTIGYKGTQVNFQTLVTRQTSSTFFSAGGVQSKPRTDAGIQGLLQSSTSQTDLGISGQGFFVVNEASVPSLSNEYLFTRAGQFFQDNNGFLRNTAGFYLQAFPVDPAGNIVPNNPDILISNTNVISTDFLTTVNLNRVGGTATATTGIAIGANLPASATSGQTHRSDVQFFDSLGTARNISFQYTRSGRDNQWNIAVDPPSGANVLTLEDTNGATFDSRGQVAFSSIPANRSSITIDGIQYQFQNFGTLTASSSNQISITDAGGANGTDDRITATTLNTFSGFAAGDQITLNGANLPAPGGPITVEIRSVAPDGTWIDVYPEDTPGGAGPFTASVVTQTADITMVPDDKDDVKIVDTSSSSTTANYVTQLVAKVKASDSDFANQGTFTNNRISVSPFNASTVLFNEDGTGDIEVNPSGLQTASGAAATAQTTSFTVRQVGPKYRDQLQLTFSQTPADNETVVINGITYEFDSNASGLTVGDVVVTIPAAGSTTAANIDTFLDNLEAAIESNDPSFASGASTVRLRANDVTAEGGSFTVYDTLVLDVLGSGSYNVQFAAGFTSLPTSPDGSTPLDADGSDLIDGTNFKVDKAAAIVFDSSGLPSTIAVAEIEILGFSNGAADFDDDPANTDQVSLDFGTVGIADGLTQFGDEFTPGFIEQDGSQFGTFAGITVRDDGLITALFDNGETRPVFKIPIATFVNVNELGTRSGNVYNSTQASGDPTLRSANSGPAGAITQSALEASTVDIGEEFTKMIVVQRAFSAATKIITTADEMLDELVRLR
ncbi:MAG: flagellar hook-basal body complex protein [Rhodospirillales bacterium]